MSFVRTDLVVVLVVDLVGGGELRQLDLPYSSTHLTQNTNLNGDYNNKIIYIHL